MTKTRLAFASCTISFALLAGCVSPEQKAIQQQQAAAAGIEQCRAMGAKTHNEFFQCRIMQEQQRTTQANAQAAQMRAVGAALLAGSQPAPQPQRRFVNCTSTPVGVTVQTTCF